MKRSSFLKSILGLIAAPMAIAAAAESNESIAEAIDPSKNWQRGSILSKKGEDLVYVVDAILPDRPMSLDNMKALLHQEGGPIGMVCVVNMGDPDYTVIGSLEMDTYYEILMHKKFRKGLNFADPRDIIMSKEFAEKAKALNAKTTAQFLETFAKPNWYKTV